MLSNIQQYKTPSARSHLSQVRANEFVLMHEAAQSKYLGIPPEILANYSYEVLQLKSTFRHYAISILGDSDNFDMPIVDFEEHVRRMIVESDHDFGHFFNKDPGAGESDLTNDMIQMVIGYRIFIESIFASLKDSSPPFEAIRKTAEQLISKTDLGLTQDTKAASIWRAWTEDLLLTPKQVHALIQKGALGIESKDLSGTIIVHPAEDYFTFIAAVSPHRKDNILAQADHVLKDMFSSYPNSLDQDRLTNLTRDLMYWHPMLNANGRLADIIYNGVRLIYNQPYEQRAHAMSRYAGPQFLDDPVETSDGYKDLTPKETYEIIKAISCERNFTCQQLLDRTMGSLVIKNKELRLIVPDSRSTHSINPLP